MTVVDQRSSASSASGAPPSTVGKTLDDKELYDISKEDVENPESKVSQSAGEHAAWSWVLFVAGGHFLISCIMPVVNKWALKEYPSSFMLTFFQLLFAVVAMLTMRALGVIHFDNPEIEKLKIYLPASSLFYVTIVVSNQLILDTSVNTYVAVRSMVPFFTAFFEIALLGTAWPPAKSLIALALMVLGGYMYVTAQSGLVVKGMVWIVIYLVAMPVDGVLIKRSLQQLNLSPWGMSFYNNFLAMCLSPFGAIALGQGSSLFTLELYTSAFKAEAIVPILIGCVLGIAISFFQMNVRHAVTATAFMILGVVNKFFSIGFEFIFIGSNLGVMGCAGVFLTIIAAVFWQYTMKDRALSTTEDAERQGQLLDKLVAYVQNRYFAIFAILMVFVSGYFLGGPTKAH